MNSQAAASLNKAFATYKVTELNEIAALISLMAFESADFKYQINYFPGRPGQGCRNMQSGAFNVQYAQSIPGLEGKVNRINSGTAAGSLSLSSSTMSEDF